jgi:SAM-dependent methyltransferase
MVVAPHGAGRRNFWRTIRMNPFGWLARTVREKGVVQTAQIAANFGADLLFDWRYGTDTMRWETRDELGATSGSLAHSRQYKATKTRPFLQLIRQLDLPRDCNFVDIGAGKGRVLLVAAQYGFRKVVGIEFSGRLCELARKNVEVFSTKIRLASPIEVIEADATTHAFAAEDRVFFLFNPFDGVILARVLENLRRSLEQQPRRVWLIYNDPQHHDVVQAAKLFRTDGPHWVGGTHFQVYVN